MQLTSTPETWGSLENLTVATPHGSDKSATGGFCIGGWPSGNVATPHGSDKSATLLFKPLKDKD